MAEVYRPSLDDPNAWVPYRYHPSRIAAIVFAVLFAITTAFHIFQLIRRRTWYFIPLVVGGLFEVVGYIGRILSTNDLWALGPYIMQSLLLLVAPALFAASIYMILGRIILLTDGERHSLVPRKWLTKVFVIGDVVSFLVQGGGGGIQAAGTLELLHTGEKIIIVGLFIQLAFFGFFITVAGLFHYRLRRHENVPSLEARNHENGSSPEAIEFQQLSSFGSSAADHTSKSSNLPWKRHIFALYVASTFIMIRSIFRVVEYLQGNNGYLLRHEVFLYIFDAALMFGVMCLFNLVHPAQVTDLYHHRTTESARNGYSS